MMKDKQTVGVVVGLSLVLTGLVVVPSWLKSQSNRAGTVPDSAELLPSAGLVESSEADATPDASKGCGTMRLGSLEGRVDYDADKDYHFLQLRGARFPFKASPLEAQGVPLQAIGRSVRERNAALITRVLGRQVQYATILIDPDEEEEVTPAAVDLALYLKLVNPRKFAGFAYTKAGGKLATPAAVGPRVQSARDATDQTPKVVLRGPKSGADTTRVALEDDGVVTVEGDSYEQLYKAADMLCLTLLKMLCGSPDCPDAAACASGGACGCG